MKTMHRRTRLIRLTAMALCLCMMISMFAGISTPRLARADGATNSATGGPTKGVKRQADPSTMDTYQTVLNIGANSRYAGRVWADKSVFAYGYPDTGDQGDKWVSSENSTNILNLDQATDGLADTIELDGDFLHVFSVLGSSLQDNEPAPADLVLALDISGSMGSSLQNESSDWVNTVNPNPDAEHNGHDGLGYYMGSGGVTNPEADDNGIPDAIVAVLPEDGDGATSYDSRQVPAGQISQSGLNNYNAYLEFCNALVNAMRENHQRDNTFSDSDVTQINGAIDGKGQSSTGNSYNIASEKRTADNYNTIYAAYLAYKAAIDAVPETENAWLSDQSTGRNASWPNEGWMNAINAVMTTPEGENPLLNAPQAPNRMYYVIEAANAFIDRFLNMNSKNRISVVVYDSVATVLMPLAHYTKVDDRTDYLSAEKHHWQSWGKGQWACTVTVKARPTSGWNSDEDEASPFGTLMDASGKYEASVTSWANTDTEAALTAGMDILAESYNAYDDMADRYPILVLMSDGAANTIVTGLNKNDSLAAQSTVENAWTQGAKVSKTETGKGGADRYNQTDGMVLNDYESNRHRTYEQLVSNSNFEDKTSAGLTTYAAGNGHVYGAESEKTTRYTVLLHTLMSAAFQKTRIEKHYNAGIEYNPAWAGDDMSEEEKTAAKAEAGWIDPLIYTIGFGLESYNEDTQEICREVLNPAETFKVNDGKAIAERTTMNEVYDGWFNAPSEPLWTTEALKFTASSAYSSLNGSTNGLNTGTLSFPISNKDLDGTEVTKADIDRNIRYNNQFYTAKLEGDGTENNQTLEDVFTRILENIQGAIFVPVSGGNDLGVTDSLTYIDPIGKYMEVKDVDSLTLFGKRYKLLKTGVYDYLFNDTYMKNNKLGLTQGEDSFPRGWYHTAADGTVTPAYPDPDRLAKQLPPTEPGGGNPVHER